MLQRFLREYYDNLKGNKLKKFINENAEKFVVKNIYDYLEIIDILESEKNKDRSNIANEFLYRGVGNSTWGLEPSLMFNGLAWCEDDMINEFKELWPGEFEGIDIFNTIAKMQHFGLPTRLLDFTTNPLVALYFACINEIDVDGKVFMVLPRNTKHLSEHMDRIFSPLMKKINLQEDLSYLYTHLQMLYGCNNIYFKRPKYLTEREKRQSSIFMLFTNNIYNYESGEIISTSDGAKLWLEEFDEDNLINRLDIDDRDLKKLDDRDFYMNFLEIIVPSSIKRTILKKLNEMGIKKSFLFPEIEYTAQNLKEKYLNISQSYEKNKFNEDYEY